MSAARPGDLEPLALSSMYFQRWTDPLDLAPFFAAGRAMGFARFELSHDLRPEALDRLAPGAARISTVHHPCPRPPDWDAGDSLLAAAPDARARAAAALRASLETAARLGARSVVLHLGRAEDDEAESIRRLGFELRNRFLAGQRDGARYAAALGALRARLAEAEARQLPRALETLPPLLERAAELGLRVGIETGHHPDELPTPGGLRRLLDGLTQPALGAWLDTGHVGAQAALGTADLADWRGAARGRWVGAHLHDLVGLRDHLAPGSGTLDLAALCAWLPEAAARSCEVDWHLATEEVREGALHLLGQGCAG